MNLVVLFAVVLVVLCLAGHGGHQLVRRSLKDRREAKKEAHAKLVKLIRDEAAAQVSATSDWLTRHNIRRDLQVLNVRLATVSSQVSELDRRTRGLTNTDHHRLDQLTEEVSEIHKVLKDHA